MEILKKMPQFQIDGENALRLATALTAYDISLVPVTYESISEVSKEVLEWSYTL